MGLEELLAEDLTHPSEGALEYERSRNLGSRTGMRAIRLLWKESGLSSLYEALLGSCPMSPSCSHYAWLALGEHGPFRGTYLSALRLARCQPFGWRALLRGEDGRFLDPVPERGKITREQPYNPAPGCEDGGKTHE